jgi:hypothetical protein
MVLALLLLHLSDEFYRLTSVRRSNAREGIGSKL